MSCLLDTHILIWWWMDDPALPHRLRQLLEESVAKAEPVSISAIVLWEIAMLADRNRIQLLASLDVFLSEIETHPLIRMLPITACVAAESLRLGPDYPRDPVDRIIGATARCFGLPLMTLDKQIRDSGVVALAG